MMTCDGECRLHGGVAEDEDKHVIVREPRHANKGV